MICDGQITSRSWGWSWRPYGGSNPHTHHGHISFRYGSGAGQDNPENITAPWGILAAVEHEEAERIRLEQQKEVEMPLSMQDVALIHTADGIIPNRPWRSDHPQQGGTNTHISARTALIEAMDQAHYARERVEAILADPTDYADPESHPLVKAMRYALANPAPTEPNV
jgi:hypothetical protein